MSYLFLELSNWMVQMLVRVQGCFQTAVAVEKLASSYCSLRTKGFSKNLVLTQIK